jgi:hypothetical protein
VPHLNYAAVILWHSEYQEMIAEVEAVFDEVKIKPMVTFKIKEHYILSPQLQRKLQTEIILMLRLAWCWGRKIRTEKNDNASKVRDKFGRFMRVCA